MTAARVVSLVPSVTETLLAWGVTPVACTRFCEQPDLPHVGGTKDPDVAAIVELAPDLVVLCVEENRREDADALTAAGIATAALSIDTVADVGPALAMLAGPWWACPPRRWRRCRPIPSRRPRAFVPIWKRPWMTLSGDTYGSSLLASIGVANVFADAAERYPTVTLDEVRVRASPTWCSPPASRTCSPNGTSPCSTAWPRSCWSTARTCSGGAPAPRRPGSACGARLSS